MQCKRDAVLNAKSNALERGYDVLKILYSFEIKYHSLLCSANLYAYSERRLISLYNFSFITRRYAETCKLCRAAFAGLGRKILSR